MKIIFLSSIIRDSCDYGLKQSSHYEVYIKTLENIWSIVNQRTRGRIGFLARRQVEEEQK